MNRAAFAAPLAAQFTAACTTALCASPLALATLSLIAACNARAADTLLQPPSGFGVRSTGTIEAVVHAEVVAHTPGPVDRASIEAQCESARAVGLTTRHPVFEPGHDALTRTETLRYGTPRHQADFVTRHIYECAAPPAASTSADTLCGCTYRMHTRRSVHIERRDLSTADPALELARVRRLMPEAMQPDTIAGIPCLWRRTRLPDDVRLERCVVEDPAGRFPAFLRGRALAETLLRHGSEVVHSSRTTRLILHATVDAGVFDAPLGDMPQEPAR
jgi:hypothetical protein